MKSETRYEKRQEGRAIQFSSAIISLAGLWLITNEARPTAGLTLLGIAGVLSMLFGSMTVSVDHEALRFHFGWGLIRKQIAFCDLRSWHVVKCHWIYGYGIRHYGKGWMYRVSGNQVVELHLVGSRQLRLGTAEPYALCAALAAALPQADLDSASL